MWKSVSLTILVVLGGAQAAIIYSSDALKDEIDSLPGAPTVPWRMFSGYIDVSAEDEEVESRQMFYWFVESQQALETDPVILWTNGGPGCSGLGGFLGEQGPFRAGKGGELLEINEFAWSKVANMVFIEQPVGVGFSTTRRPISYGDAQAAKDNYRFVLNFFERYPQYSAHDFYISSESYGGHYMPTLAKQIKESGMIPNFRGVFVGNPLTYMMYRNYGEFGTAWGHQLFPQPLWARYEQAQCATTFPPSDACNNVTTEMGIILNDFDPYALDFPTCKSIQAVGRFERWAFRRTILRAHAAIGSQKLQVNSPYEPCIQDFYSEYLNRADVQQAIHVKNRTEWTMCSNTVGEAYNITDVNAPMMPVWKWLIETGEMNIMIYSGDDDSVCATLGTQQFVWDLGYAPKEGMQWKPWKVNGQIAGFQTSFQVPSKDSHGSFAFATVHGAGHMVPATQPERSLVLLKQFLTGYGVTQSSQDGPIVV